MKYNEDTIKMKNKMKMTDAMMKIKIQWKYNYENRYFKRYSKDNWHADRDEWETTMMHILPVHSREKQPA